MTTRGQTQTKIFSFTTTPTSTSALLLAPLSISYMANPTTRRMATRGTNAAQHPGAVDAKKHRRTKAEMELDRIKKKAEADALEAIQKAKVERIADMEESMAVDDANEETPKPGRLASFKPLRRTETLLLGSEASAESAPSVDSEYIDKETSDGGDTDVEEQLPPKKKTKTDIRADVGAARKVIVALKKAGPVADQVTSNRFSMRLIRG